MEILYNSITAVLTDVLISQESKIFIMNVEEKLPPMSVLKTGLRNSDAYIIRPISTRSLSAIKKGGKKEKYSMFCSNSKVSTDSCC